MTRRFLTHAITAMTLATLVLTGCSPAGTSTESTHDTASPGALSLGWTPGPASPQIPLAAGGLWSTEGVDVTVNTFTSGREALESLLGGGLDVAVLAELPAVTAAMNASEIRVVDTLSTYGSYRVIGNASRGITDDLSSLEGKKIGTTVGTNIQFATDELLAESGINAEIVNVGPADLVSALARGDIDAAVPFESAYPAAQSTLGSDYLEIPIPKDVYTGNMIVAVSTEAATERADAVQALVTGLVQASDKVAEDPAAAQTALVDATGGTLTADYLSGVWDDYDYTPQLSDDLLALMVREGKWVQRQGTIGADLTIDDAYFKKYIDDSFLTTSTQ
jgi:NitT/TauT family transport system substrate-binding protein